MDAQRKLRVLDHARDRVAVVDLYLAFGGGDLKYLAAQHALLEEEESARAARFLFAADCELYRASHVLLRHSLSQHVDLAPEQWRFERTARGRPEIDRKACPTGGDLRFSLAHTRGFACCAVTWGLAVGVDAEENRQLPDAVELARNFFSPVEFADVANAPSDARSATFLTRWCLKEAYLKAIGVGLDAALDGFSFRLTDDTPAHVSMQADSLLEPQPENWRFGFFHVKDAKWMMATAVRTHADVVFRIHRISASVPTASVTVIAHSSAVRAVEAIFRGTPESYKLTHDCFPCSD